MELYSVRINGLPNPLGFDLDVPVCSWKVRSAMGERQTAAAIRVASDPDMSRVVYEKSGEDLDSTGAVLDLPLSPCTRYYYQVQVESNRGETATSPVRWFETAKLSEPWMAEWIAPEESFSGHPVLQTSFSLDNDVEKARLYICGLGLFEAFVNGEKAGDDFLAPFLNDYEEHVQYCTYDVTDLLKTENELTVFLGNGWYRGKFGLACATHYERPFALIAELRITYLDGSVRTVVTNPLWTCKESFLTFSDIYDGESQDYAGWNPHAEARPVRVVKAPAPLVARYSPTLCAMEELPVKELITTPAGETVLDFGQNFAGFVRCIQPVPAGVTLKLEFGELLQNGNFYHDNYRTAKSEFSYTSDGEARPIRPWFTFYGFRYVKVSGLETVDPSCFTGCVVYSKMDRTGTLHTGDERVNRLYENTVWGMKSNFLDLPTDCPQRDERLGWSGDALVFSRTAGFHMDTRAFYAKFLRDLRSDQKRHGGKVAMYLPNEFAGLYAGVWCDVGNFISNMLYRYYGSKELLAQNYPLMKDWSDFIHEEDVKRGERNLYDWGFQYGDWLALDGATEQSNMGRTDKFYVASMYYYASTQYTADAAKVLGLPEAAVYAERAEKIRAAILDEFFSASGRLCVDTQTGYLLALQFGVYKDKARIVDALRARVKQDCNRIKGGFVGATCMNRVLAENGLADLAYDFLFYEGFPGWLYEVKLGATTIWERWNSVLPDGTISGTSMNSMNHYSFGAVSEFLYRNAAGINEVLPGFRKARIEPQPDIRLGHLECSFDSAAGRYVVNWKILDDGSLSFHVEIPFGCTADVVLPEQPVQTLPAGIYNFECKTERDYRQLYTANTPFERLLQDPEAVAVLDQYLPGGSAGIDRNDAEAMAKGLAELRYKMALFRQPTESVDKAIAEIEAIRAS